MSDKIHARPQRLRRADSSKPAATRLASAIALGLALTCAQATLHAQEVTGQAQPAQAATSQAAGADAQSGEQGQRANNQEAQNLGTVTVTGMRASLESAQSLKQNASQIVDSVTATDINALPDRSVTETLQRISGVTVDHFLADDDPDHPSAEGSGVLIRGLTYVASELNGRDSFSANNGRALGFEDVPAELMAGVDVYKNPSAELIEGGIGGTVNLRTRMPFDSQGQTTAASIGWNEGDMAKKGKPEASVLWSDRWHSDSAGDFGFLFDAAYSELATRDDGIQTNPYLLEPSDNLGAGPYEPTSLAGQNGTVAIPGGINWQEMDMQRKRLGLYGAFQWRPTDDLEIYSTVFRSTYSLQWNEHEVQNNEGQYYDMASVPGTDFTYDDNGVYQDGDMAAYSWQGGPPGAAPTLNHGDYSDGTPLHGANYYADNRMNTQYTTTTDWSSGFKFNLSDHWKMSGDFQFVKSTSNTLDFSVYNQFYMPPGDVNLSGSVPSMTLGNPAYQYTPDKGSVITTNPNSLADPSNYYLGAAMDHLEYDYGIERALRLDWEYSFDGGWLQTFKFGVRGTDRDAHSNNFSSNYNWGPISQVWSGGYTGPSSLDWLPNIPSSMYEQYNMSNFYRGANLPSTLYFASNALVKNYYKAIQQLYALELPGGGGWCAQGTPAGVCDSPATSVGMYSNNMDEKTEAAYATLYFGSPDDSFDGNVGVRLIHTQDEANGSITYPTAAAITGDSSTISDAQMALFTGAVVPTSGKSDYNDVLPSLNLRYKFTNTLQWRFAASKAMTRPNISQLNSYTIIGTAWSEAGGQEASFAGFTAVTGGNANLKPMTASQFDTALEWYFSKSGELYTTLFYKDIHDYINTETSNEVIDGQNVAVTGPVNAGNGTVKGFEVGYSQFFDFLPGAWSGLGVQANYTFLQSTKVAGTTSQDPNHPNGSATADDTVTNPPLPMAGLSPHNYNLTAMYEHSNWSARLAWSWRSRYLITSEDSGDTYLPMWSAASGQLDGSVFYHVNKSVQVGLQANNITNTTTKVLMGPTTYTNGTIDWNLYTRSIFLNDRRYEIVLRSTF